MHWFYVENTRDFDPVRSRLYILAQRKKLAGRQYHRSVWCWEARREARELGVGPNFVPKEERVRFAQERGKAYGIKLVIEKIPPEEENSLEAVINEFIMTQGYLDMERWGIPVRYIEEFLRKKR
ncbi:hypothetical protein HYS50_00795 [Candidatus Woesearchaeota archaeon]|nr:hypothetical protein [Candidatus Woesearchaeota archaeon]